MARRVLVGKLQVAPAADTVMSREHALRELISTETVRLCEEAYGEDLTAIILTGSLARDEATFVQEGANWRVLGDAEFLLPFQSRADVPSAASVHDVSESIQRALASHGVTCKITLGPVGPDYLRKIEPSIFGYELKACGRVIWGNEGILSLIPQLSIRDIPLEDAWRMLANRMVELLEAVIGAADPSKPMTKELHYRTVKLYLDMATSLLLFSDEYAPTYRQRAAKLSSLDELAGSDGFTRFALREFSDHVANCTRWKLDPVQKNLPATWELLSAAIRHAEGLWRFELARVTGLSPRTNRLDLEDRWMQLQPAPERLKGFLYVLRQREWSKSLKDWPRWLSLAFRGSPRYWVYKAASEIFFRLPKLLQSDGVDLETDVSCEELSWWLPVREAPLTGSLSGWQRAASAVAWNYHVFLEKTRA